MADALLERAGAFLEVPYRLHGHTLAGWDCLGLVKTLRRELFGKETPYGVNFYTCAEAHDLDVRDQLLAAGARAWRKVERAPGVVVLFRRLGRLDHVGLMLSGGWFIHASDTTNGTMIEELRGAWLRRVEGYFDAE